MIDLYILIKIKIDTMKNYNKHVLTFIVTIIACTAVISFLDIIGGESMKDQAEELAVALSASLVALVYRASKSLS